MAQPAQAARGGGGAGLWPTIATLIALWLAVNYVFVPKKHEIRLPADGTPAPAGSVASTPPAKVLSPAFSPGMVLDLYVYYGEEKPFASYNDTSRLLWKSPGFQLGDYEPRNYRRVVLSLEASEHIKNNGSAYALLVFVPRGRHPDPRNPQHDARHTFVRKHPLVRYWPDTKKLLRKNLMTGEEKEVEVQQSQPSALTAPLLGTAPEVALVGYWRSNLTVTVVDDWTHYAPASTPQPLLDAMQFTSEGRYFPVVFVNDFWLLRETYPRLNASTTQLNLTIDLEPISLMKWMLYSQLEQSFEMQMKMGAVSSEIDEIRRMLLETNPYLLATTVAVSLLHMLFDFLAFKNDISFWKSKKNLEGLSVRTLFLNCFSQMVIFLYLLDNDTSWMIMLSVGMGLAIEVWKVSKAVVLQVRWRGWLPTLGYQDRQSYSSKTREYDEQAMGYLTWLLIPLVVGYSIYALRYQTHKSWYSWVVASLTGTVYTFGFVTMTPQLFINYKLKSVAHLPWRTFMYKALNTFVDDLFAFVIRMPLLHRLACFRDDIIFLVYLYQRWVYPVDKKRVNEFGQQGEDPDPAADVGTPAPAPTPAPEAAASKKEQ
jgi:hypothetical protein